MKDINPHLPINKAAAIVVSRDNNLTTEFKCGCNVVSLVELPTIFFYGEQSKDLTGKKFGRMTVVGSYALDPFVRIGRSKVPKWVVRCSCGRHEIRKSRAIKNIDNDNDACVECRKTDYLSKRNLYEGNNC